MATFKSADLSATNSGTDQLSFTADGTTIIGLVLANTSAKTIYVDVQVRSVFLIKNAVIPASSTLSVLDGKLIVNNTDTITVTTDAADSTCDVICSYLEV